MYFFGGGMHEGLCVFDGGWSTQGAWPGLGFLAVANLPRLLVTTQWQPGLPGTAWVIKKQQHSRRMTGQEHTEECWCTQTTNCDITTEKQCPILWHHGVYRGMRNWIVHTNTHNSHHPPQGEPVWVELAKWESFTQFLDHILNLQWLKRSGYLRRWTLYCNVSANMHIPDLGLSQTKTESIYKGQKIWLLSKTKSAQKGS